MNGVFKGTTKVCSECHDNRIASGRSAGHPPTTKQCQACHATTAWTSNIKFDHAEASAACGACHNGHLAKGKPATHPKTSD
ncbi:MAG: hypothetical protein JSR86_16010, partial [Proteobacteria bacterium]|nr:hypothetical protein [Pseudomonadota bacterium]